MDLADLRSIKRAAVEFQTYVPGASSMVYRAQTSESSQEIELHLLFNNAGVMFPPIEKITVDKYDLQFGTNVLGEIAFNLQESHSPLFIFQGTSTSRGFFFRCCSPLRLETRQERSA